MTILDKIIIQKKEEVAAIKKTVEESRLTDMPYFNRACHALPDFVKDKARTGIIAEYKRASPSKGIINDTASVIDVVSGYEQAGASAVSVLTDSVFFQGSLDDLVEARKAINLPILRKDFVVDAYQILEAKAYGADVILLIAAVLKTSEVHRLSEFAKNLGLNVLVEVHNRNELEKSIYNTVDAIGVNNRNLHDFTVSIQHSLDLVNLIPDRYIKISESGISEPEAINQLKAAGFDGFLIGEYFMKHPDPIGAIRTFIDAIG